MTKVDDGHVSRKRFFEYSIRRGISPALQSTVDFRLVEVDLSWQIY